MLIQRVYQVDSLACPKCGGRIENHFFSRGPARRRDPQNPRALRPLARPAAALIPFARGTITGFQPLGSCPPRAGRMGSSSQTPARSAILPSCAALSVLPFALLPARVLLGMVLPIPVPVRRLRLFWGWKADRRFPLPRSTGVSLRQGRHPPRSGRGRSAPTIKMPRSRSLRPCTPSSSHPARIR